MKRCEKKILKGIKCDEISKNIRWMVRWNLDVERNCQFVHSYSNEPSSMQKKVIVLLSENSMSLLVRIREFSFFLPR